MGWSPKGQPGSGIHQVRRPAYYRNTIRCRKQTFGSHVRLSGKINQRQRQVPADAGFFVPVILCALHADQIELRPTMNQDFAEALQDAEEQSAEWAYYNELPEEQDVPGEIRND